MKRLTHAITAATAAAAIAVLTPTNAFATTRLAAPSGGRGPSAGGSLTTETRVVRDLGCFGFDTCNEVIALCIGAGHEYHGDSDQGWCDTNDNGKNDGHSPD